jgi:hypothetical protein
MGLASGSSRDQNSQYLDPSEIGGKPIPRHLGGDPYPIAIFFDKVGVLYYWVLIHIICIALGITLPTMKSSSL